jgi:hypothetical protein
MAYAPRPRKAFPYSPIPAQFPAYTLWGEAMPAIRPKTKTVRAKTSVRPKVTAKSAGLKVVGYEDQHGDKWLRVGFKDQWAFARRAALVGDPSKFFSALERQDVAIFSLRETVRQKAERAVFEKKAYVVDRFGWQEATYVQPGAEVPEKINGAKTIDNRPMEDANWGTNGSAEEWRRGLERFAKSQALPTFVLGCAFASILQHLVPEIDDNVGFELFHGTSIGKSRLLLLAASVFGPPREFRRDWNTTVNALEKTMKLRGDALLLLDEINHFLESAPGAKAQLGMVVHDLTAGSEKARFDAPEQRNHRFTFLSTTNEPIREVVKGIGPSRVEAVEVRMPTIPAEADPKLGIFDVLPADCTDSADAVKNLTLFAQAHLSGVH